MPAMICPSAPKPASRDNLCMPIYRPTDRHSPPLSQALAHYPVLTHTHTSTHACMHAPPYAPPSLFFVMPGPVSGPPPPTSIPVYALFRPRMPVAYDGRQYCHWKKTTPPPPNGDDALFSVVRETNFRPCFLPVGEGKPEKRAKGEKGGKREIQKVRIP